MDAEVARPQRRRVVIHAQNGAAICYLPLDEARALEDLVARAREQHEQSREQHERERRKRACDRAYWARLTPEQKRRKRERKLAKMTPAQRRKKREYERAYRAQMSDEQHERYKARRRAQYASIRASVTMNGDGRQASSNGSTGPARARRSAARAA